MIDKILFYAIGIFGLYFLFKLARKEAIEGKCASCPNDKRCKPSEPVIQNKSISFTGKDFIR